jgi:hypothetical protein
MSELPFEKAIGNTSYKAFILQISRFHVDAVKPSCMLVLPSTGSSLSACTCAREREALGSLLLVGSL